MFGNRFATWLLGLSRLFPSLGIPSRRKCSRQAVVVPIVVVVVVGRNAGGTTPPAAGSLVG
jgi:hypothetical protein